MSLKSEYHPESVNEDYLIEDVLQRAFRSEALEVQPSKLDFDFLEISTKNRTEVDVEEYKKMFAKQRKKLLRKEKRKKNKR